VEIYDELSQTDSALEVEPVVLNRLFDVGPDLGRGLDQRTRLAMSKLRPYIVPAGRPFGSARLLDEELDRRHHAENFLFW
jgi:hypothetical protein